MTEFKSIAYFRHWCQKVLPAVYDDSLSYYELLCKVTQYLNYVIEDINAVPDYIRELLNEETIGELLSVMLDELREQIARANEGKNTTASYDRSEGELVWLDGKLIVMTRDILAGDRYVENVEGITGNFDYTSIEKELDKIKYSVTSLATNVNNRIVNLATSINDRINETNARIDDVSEGLHNSVVSINNRLLPLEAMPTKRTFILIGDSFGYGIQGGGAAWVTGWLEYAHDKIVANGDDCFYLENPLQAEGNMGFASTRPWLSVLEEIESTYDIDASKVTDIIVLGGSNDAGQTQTSIRTAITLFCNHCKNTYPNANISIGTLAVNATLIGDVHVLYKECCKTNGVKFINDLYILMINPNYYSAGGHVTEAGYNFYNPYIADCVINGTTHYKFNYTITAELTEHASFEAGTFPLALFVEQTERTIKVEVMDSARSSPTPIKLDSKVGTTFNVSQCISFTNFYAPLINQIICGGTITLKEDGNSTRIPCRNGAMYFSSNNKIGINGSFYFDGTYNLIYGENNYYASLVYNRGEAITFEIN